MAYSGVDFGYEDKSLDDKIDNDDYDDDYDQEEVNRTQPFQPVAASTPGEQYEMQTMRHEQRGLPDTSYEETPLLGVQAQMQRSWDAFTRFFLMLVQQIWRLLTAKLADYKSKRLALEKTL